MHPLSPKSRSLTFTWAQFVAQDCPKCVQECPRRVEDGTLPTPSPSSRLPSKMRVRLQVILMIPVSSVRPLKNMYKIWIIGWNGLIRSVYTCIISSKTPQFGLGASIIAFAIEVTWSWSRRLFYLIRISLDLWYSSNATEIACRSLGSSKHPKTLRMRPLRPRSPQNGSLPKAQNAFQDALQTIPGSAASIKRKKIAELCLICCWCWMTG